jgi:hypothetical protein
MQKSKPDGLNAMASFNGIKRNFLLFFEQKPKNLTQKTTPQLTIRQIGTSSPALRDAALWLVLISFGEYNRD